MVGQDERQHVTVLVHLAHHLPGVLDILRRLETYHASRLRQVREHRLPHRRLVLHHKHHELHEPSSVRGR